MLFMWRLSCLFFKRIGDIMLTFIIGLGCYFLGWIMGYSSCAANVKLAFQRRSQEDQKTKVEDLRPRN